MFFPIFIFNTPASFYGRPIKDATGLTKDIFKFLKKIKQKKTIEEIAKYFGISISEANGCLVFLKKKNLVECELIENKKYYFVV